MFCFAILVTLLFVCASIGQCYTFPFFPARHRETRLYYDREMLQNSEMLLVLPLDSIKLAEITSLNKGLVSEPYKAVISKANLIDLVDRTPYCQIIDHISDQNVCFFIQREVQANYESFTKWIRQIKKGEDRDGSAAFEILVCKKEHFIRFTSSDE